MLSSRALHQSLRAAAPRAAVLPRTAVRGYAAESANSKPPIALFGIGGTYASALYTAAVKSSTLEPTAKLLAQLSESFKKDPKLAAVLNTPTLSSADKQSITKELLKTLGSAGQAKDGETVKGLLNTLADNNRLSTLHDVCEKFTELMSAHRGEIELRVTSAAPLDQKILRNLETTISKSKYVQQGQKLKVVSKVQPDIRGGLIVEIGDRTIDLSVSSKMARMNKLLHETL